MSFKRVARGEWPSRSFKIQGHRYRCQLIRHTTFYNSRHTRTPICDTDTWRQHIPRDQSSRGKNCVCSEEMASDKSPWDHLWGRKSQRWEGSVKKIRCKTGVTERGSYDRHAVRLSVLPVALWHTIRYDTRCYFNVRSKADISQLNLPHGTDN